MQSEITLGMRGMVNMTYEAIITLFKRLGSELSQVC